MPLDQQTTGCTASRHAACIAARLLPELVSHIKPLRRWEVLETEASSEISSEAQGCLGDRRRLTACATCRRCLASGMQTFAPSRDCGSFAPSWTQADALNAQRRLDHDPPLSLTAVLSAALAAFPPWTTRAPDPPGTGSRAEGDASMRRAEGEPRGGDNSANAVGAAADRKATLRAPASIRAASCVLRRQPPGE
jgi:hypothetical protein